MEVLARGPIHEAFAEPVEGVPQAGPVIVKAPPPPVEEIPPDQAPQGNMQWIPGYWSWDDDRKDFVWVSGIWRQPPPDREWVPGQWIQVANGWQWTAGMWNPVAQTQVNYLPPPPAPLEAAASSPAPTPTSFFIPGTWYYHQTRYVWRPGYWLEPQVGWVWIPARYVWTPAGYIFLEGHWDFDLSRRGLLFAPVYFTSPIYRRPAWSYRPTFVVQTDFLMGALFIRPGCSTYYFGDYFDVAYRRRGFVSFVDFRFGRTGIDPLFGYYRWSNRSVPHWENDLRGMYVNRYNNVAVRPPRTLVQQTTVINNITINKNVTNIRNNQVLVSLNQVKQQGNIRLQPVTPQRLAAERLQAKNFQATSIQRVKAEQAVVVKGSAPTRQNDKPYTWKLDGPGQRPAVTTNTAKIPTPPLPTGSRPRNDGPKGTSPGRPGVGVANPGVNPGAGVVKPINPGTKPPLNNSPGTGAKPPANTQPQGPGMKPGAVVIPPNQGTRPAVPPGQTAKPNVPPGQTTKPKVPPSQTTKPGTTPPIGQKPPMNTTPPNTGGPGGKGGQPAVPPGQGTKPANPPTGQKPPNMVITGPRGGKVIIPGGPATKPATQPATLAGVKPPPAVGRGGQVGTSPGQGPKQTNPVPGGRKTNDKPDKR
jgi:hypothetical protein